jgi:2-polyprenyl-6-methoxyphenol hydroxylase-like FAD-dependent oxidoreductase
MLLARKGYRVLMVDKATFPSEAISTDYIHQPGVERLARWGLLERVVQSGCPAISNAQLDLGGFVLRGSTNREAGSFDAYAPRRRVLDKILFDAAVDAGAEAREGFSVDEILNDGKRVTGIRGHAHGDSSVTEFARLVIGADGMHSILARSAAARAYNTLPTLTCAYFSYWEGVAMDHAEAYLRPGLVVAAWPTNDGLVVVFVAAPRDQFQKFRADVEGNWMARIDRLPLLADRIRAGRRVGRFSGTGDLPNFFR